MPIPIPEKPKHSEQDPSKRPEASDRDFHEIKPSEINPLEGPRASEKQAEALPSVRAFEPPVSESNEDTPEIKPDLMQPEISLETLNKIISRATDRPSDMEDVLTQLVEKGNNSEKEAA